MRSNGLTAPAYTPIADVNPAFADAILDELKTRGIAAYSKPADRATTAGFDRPDFKTELCDRVYVDASAADRAREVIAAHDPTLTETNDDLAWAQIVAGYDAPVSADGVAPWPAFEDLDPAGEDGNRDGNRDGERGSAADPFSPYDDTSATGGRHRRGPSDQPDDRAGVGSAFGDLGLEDVSWRRQQPPPGETVESHDRYVPPPPPPLPRLGLVQQLAWLGVLGGPVVLLLAAVFTLPIPTWLELLAALGFVAGFVTLVLGMDNRSHDELDGDDGAQV